MPNRFVYLNLAGTWTEVTDHVLAEPAISIRHGSTGEAGSVEPSTCDLTLDNRSGDYSLRNPLSPHYGKLGRNTGIKVAAGNGLTAFGMSGLGGFSGATTPDSAALSIVGDLDIRIDATALRGGWTSAICSLLDKGDIGGQFSWAFKLNAGTLVLEWSADGSTVLSASVAVPGSLANRRSLRATIDVNNGAAGRTITFYHGPAGMAGAWTTIGSAVVQAGVTSIFDGTAPVRVLNGNNLPWYDPLVMHAAELRNGIAGAVVASPNFAGQPAETRSWSDTQTNPWTIATVTSTRIDHWADRTRFVGEVAEWPPTWDPTTRFGWIEITAAGSLRRALASDTEALSTVERWALKRDGMDDRTTTVQYWPLDEPAGSIRAYPEYGPNNPLSFSKAAADATVNRFGGGSLTDWLPQCVRLGQADALTGQISFAPSVAIGSGYSIDLAFSADEQTVFTVRIDGSNRQVWYCTVNVPAGTVTLLAQPTGDTFTGNLLDPALGGHFDLKDGAPRNLHLDVYRLSTGGLELWMFAHVYNLLPIGDGTFPKYEFGVNLGGGISNSRPQRITITTAAAAASQTAMGHLTVCANTELWQATQGGEAMAGRAGEYVHSRLLDLFSELGSSLMIPDRSTGDVHRMGIRYIEPLPTLVERCVRTGAGLLYDSRESRWPVYVSGRFLSPGASYGTGFGMAYTVDLSYAAHEIQPPLELVDDDRYLANDVTFTSTDSRQSFQRTLDTGPLSTLDPAAGGAGRYPVSETVSVYRDGSADALAAFRLARGTVDAPRCPRIKIHLNHPAIANNATLLDQLKTIGVGCGLTLKGLSGLGIYDSQPMLVLGYAEVLGGLTWTMDLVCVPAAPYIPGRLQGGIVPAGLARLDSATSTLATGVNSSATSLSVASGSGGEPELWVTGAVSFDIIIGGERMTVTNITGASSPQTFTVTRSVNGVVKAQASGQRVRLFAPAKVGL